MPFIHVRALPIAGPFDVADVVANLCRDFAEATRIPIEHVTATWETLAPGAYAVGGATARDQPRHSHPVLVDLLAPENLSTRDIAVMLRAVAASIARRAGIPAENVFINHRQARSGMVFDAGDVVRF